MLAKQSFIAILAAVLIACALNYRVATSAEPMVKESFRELLERSEKERKGLNFYVRGQTIGGAVTKIGPDYVEVKNQTYSRIIIKIDSIDAIAIN
jgi:hypothetical protein